MKLGSILYCQSSLIILLSIFDLSYGNCPELCDRCSFGHLNCVIPGLTEIPTMTKTRLQKVTIQKQTFLNTDLSSANFSTFTSISQLSIRASNINRVLPFAFSKLTSLQRLDLSENAELIVKEMAFSGLSLHILKLDNMGIITLDLEAFLGLSVRSLSIQNSNLLELPLKLIQPLSKSLQKLFLKNNHLRTLDPQFQPIFQSIDVLELQKNPFICNCSILWLSKILEVTATASASKSNDQLFGSSDDLYPSCVSPTELRKKFLHDIAGKLKNCSPPNIIRIDVSFDSSYSSAIIDCIADRRKDTHQQTFVGWLPPSETMTDTRQWKHSVTVTRQSSPKTYLCQAVNDNGNSEIGFHIDWFKSQDETNSSLNKTLLPNNNNTQKNRSILWRTVFSLFEMICAIVGTLIITVIIFLIFCCCHGRRLHIPFLEKERKFSSKTPPQYERTVYSDDRRFCETDIDVRLFPPPPPTPPLFPASMMMFPHFGK